MILSPFKFAQSQVDRVGMYRVVSGSLGILALIAVIAGFAGLIAYSGIELLTSLILALVFAVVLNGAIGHIFKIPVNQESAIITALILFFLAIPGISIYDNWPLVVAIVIAIVSKYVFAHRKQHIANPAALGAAFLSVSNVYTFGWWVATPFLFIPLVLLGSLVVMKVRKWIPVLTFVFVSLILFATESIARGVAVPEILNTFFFSWPTLFLALFMLTEPFTMPATKEQQMFYGGLVAFLSNSSLASIFFGISPELALVIANILLINTRLSQKLILELQSKELIAKDTFEYVFKKPADFHFKPGQYLEWMLPHEKGDARGPRRYFTIAASPTESDIRVSMKHVENGSSYKKAIQTLDIGGKVIASQLAGDFLLPKKQHKLAFVAGGIGVTPFRSHIKHMVDSGKVHDTVMYYCCNTKEEVAYRNLFAEAKQKINLEVIEVIAKEEVTAPDEKGFVTEEMIKRRTPDYLERYWYLSGPPGMVNAYSRLLSKMGVPQKQIKKDFFPGLA